MGSDEEPGRAEISAPAVAALAFLALAAVAWALTIWGSRNAGMDMDMGMGMGSLGSFAAGWTVMMAAMMLPSALPAVASFAGRRAGAPLLFAASYVAVWAVVGIVAFAAYRGIRAADLGFLAWDRAGAWIAGAAVVAAGLYELTPLKRRSLRRCRSAPHGGSPFRKGLGHGLDCVGCSGALMAVLFVLGVMSLFWMALVAAAIFAEKVLPRGPRLAPVFAVALVVLGVWVAVSPVSVPGLTAPGGSPSTRMEQ